MAGVFAAYGVVALCLAFAALELSTLFNSQCGAGKGTGTTTSAEAPLLHNTAAAEVLPPLAAVVVLFVAVALIYYHLMGRRVVAAVPVAGAGRRSIISGLVMFALCISVGTLEVIVFGRGQAAGGGHGAQQARALGLAALRALPAAATFTFFSGMVLILASVAHVRAGGTGAVAGYGPIQGLLRVVPKVAAGSAAALVGLLAMAFAFCGAKF